MALVNLMKIPSFSVIPLITATVACLIASLVLTLPATGAEPPPAAPDADGTFHIPAFLLPESSLLDDATRAALADGRSRSKAAESFNQHCPKREGADRARIHEIRLCNAEAVYKLPFYQKLRAQYPVTLTPQTIGGVYTEVFTPANGVAEKNPQRVLINLHGGGFVDGSRTSSQVESVPIASLGQIKVVSVDYRLAPEYQFPAASEDVEAVYRELLKTYDSQNIGIYGCSAGGMLTAQVVAWLQWKGLPAPGAVGMFCGAAYWWADGDSGHLQVARLPTPEQYINARKNPYLMEVDLHDPLAYPGRSDEILARFPPSLLITSTRDLAISSVVRTHSRLVANGVDARLHVWEGLEHAFFLDFNLPESREVYDVIVKFFDRTLGTPVKYSDIAPTAALESSLQDQITEFVKGDQISRPSPCQVLFVGSSSIVFWRSLAHDMAPLPVINRGFGGSQIEYVNRWFDAVVAPYHPRAIVFYAGENDVAAGKPPERVIADFDAFMKKKDAVLRTTPVYFISLKPSKLRWWQFRLQSEVNGAIRARAASRTDLHYVDVVSPMLEEGKPKDLFLDDHLHLSPQGYAVWTQAVLAALLPDTQAEQDQCLRRR
jgi:epsilon-lactone hydrolase